MTIDKKLDILLVVAHIVCYLSITIAVIMLVVNYINTDKLIKLYNHAQEIKNGEELRCKPLIVNNKDLIYVCIEK
jgi:uncharacterized membrane protein YdbT with pleckstrin-like domain